ncbi:pterin-4-alpha-carbinolamine dehydratase [Alteribacillus persepolensis]|uniref:4a-hydroxytetrahydrobiopterin dehydratase n=1 Tax=Alteribacillus persepolensis TaxID=568899 RepID=A0A1G8K1R5_9BACI|nr:4a-hydroxytetrahydrobiopterin dehydratase [Alteribacillus persepolensis]SDI37364.1 pterin-4-alpha-carbinolamine dehydratase [Alteribacillus persepolensis]
MSTLSNEEIEEKLSGLEGWIRADAKTIERNFSFPAFMQGISFVEQTAQHAEEVNHHPHITIDHTSVTIRLSTLDAGGITMKDIDSASQYNRIFDSLS